MNQNIKSTLQWTIRYQNDPEFSHIRFKTTGAATTSFQTGSFDFIGKWLDLVPRKEFFTPEPNRLPLFIGSQFGIRPYLDRNKEFLTGQLRVAILGKSQLSGCVAGLQILDVDLVQSDPEKSYCRWKVIHQVRFFSNAPDQPIGK